MASWQWFGRIHRAIYRGSGGRVGARLAGIPMLLLTTTGRRSGAARTQPLAYAEIDGRIFVVGSNNGSDRHPAWWLNLEADPRAGVQIGSRSFTAHAHEVQGEERARLWPRLAAANRAWPGYTKKTRRILPVVELTPVDDGGDGSEGGRDC